MRITAILFICASFLPAILAKGSDASIECGPEVMKVTVPMDGDRQVSYLDQMKDYKPCLPILENKTAMYILDLQDFHKCGVARITNSITGKRTFYHKIVIEYANGGREIVTVKCMVYGDKHLVAKRETEPFPLDLHEPEILNISNSAVGNAPDPILNAIVKQNGKQVSGEISVSPGTPLMMEIFLDDKSANVYGLLVNYMQVTDTGKQQETIIFNGCSVDPQLFDNFLTADGDRLAAKFKAFKFPDTSYVQFKGTVSVCVDKCQGVQCTNGVLGYGRRRRSIAATDSNKVYEVSLTTFIKVDWADGEERPSQDIEGSLLKNLQIANQKLGDIEDLPSKLAEEIKANATSETTQLGGAGNTVRYSSLLLLTSLCLCFK